jgi:hypothetical protein
MGAGLRLPFSAFLKKDFPAAMAGECHPQFCWLMVSS